MSTDDKVVVLGQYSDQSGLSDVVYGPYLVPVGKEVAGRLNAGKWYGMNWQVIPIGRLPGDKTAGVLR